MFTPERRGGTPKSYIQLISWCEITTVLVLLLVAKPARDAHTLGPTLERYRKIEDSFPPAYLNEDTFYGLQSVVLAADSQHADALRATQTELWFLLGPLQNDLMDMVATHACQ